jgi:ATP-binding cassette subfamily B protein/subfamily B ATP-binding cassette protein MsbA
MRRYRLLLPYLARESSWLLATVLFTAGLSAIAALAPWPMKILVDSALGSEAPPSLVARSLDALRLEAGPTVLLGWAAAASLALFALRAVLEAGGAWSQRVGGRRMVHELATDLFRHLQRLSLLFHQRRPTGDSLSRISGDSYCVQTVVDAALLRPVSDLLTIAAVVGLAWQLDPGLTLLCLGVTPVLAASALAFGRPLKRRARQGREARARITSFVHQTLGAVPMVQAVGAEPENRRRFGRLADAAVRAARRGAAARSSFGVVNGVTTTAGAALILYVGGLRVLAGALSVGSLLAFVAYTRTLHGALQGLMGTWARLRRAEASLDRVAEILEADETVPEAPDAAELALPPGAKGASVSFEGVTFGYEPGRPVLSDLHLEIEPGETVAVVGPTGAGKSSLASLVPRLFDPWSGTVRVAGVDVRDLRLDSLRDHVSIMLQDPFLLSISVADNIAYGRPGASPEEIRAAAEAANAARFVERLPEGYDTILAERGATLSGGERQRIAIARALLRDAPILILDEPTSSLDAANEADVVEALRRLTAGRTTLLVTHRATTARIADRLCVVERGRIVETRRPGDAASDGPRRAQAGGAS